MALSAAPKPQRRQIGEAARYDDLRRQKCEKATVAAEECSTGGGPDCWILVQVLPSTSGPFTYLPRRFSCDVPLVLGSVQEACDGCSGVDGTAADPVDGSEGAAAASALHSSVGSGSRWS